MTELVRSRRSLVKPVALSLGVLLLAVLSLAGAWLLWIVLRPAPAGFAPTTGQALGVEGQPPDIVQFTLDARSRKDWVYFDFERGTTVSTGRENLDWDLAFRRTDLLTNSGDTNPEGKGGAVDLGDATLDAAVVPADGYLPDVTDDERGLENPAMHKWYNYNWTTHIITSKNHTYALRTAEGEVVVLRFLSYYCDDGSSGCVTIQYSLPTAP